MILTYRLINGMEKVDYRKFFSLQNNHYNLRGHNQKIVKTNVQFKMRWVAGVGCSVLQILLILTSLHSILSPRNIAAHRQAQQVHHGPTGTTHLYSYRTLINFNGFNFVGILREGARSVPVGRQLGRHHKPTPSSSSSLDGN